MSGRRNPTVDAPGQDSFLDIVSNLVGILIILVMVVGVQAKSAMVNMVPTTTQAPEPEVVDVATPTRATASLRDDVVHLEEMMNHQQVEVAYRQKERDKFLERLTAARFQLNSREEALDEAESQQVAVQAELSQYRSELAELEQQRLAVENAVTPSEVVKHIPTPLAKTVFGQEVHFRLLNGYVTYVPLDELVERFQVEAKQNVWRLKESPRLTEMVGPVRGFHLKYTLKRSSGVVATSSGSAYQQKVVLDHFDLIPISDQLGEPIDVATAAESEFRAVLAAHDSRRTTVTIWVYPDSYDDFRKLKQTALDMGYLTAGRPLPFGRYISGSPDGSRSAAQ